MNSFNSADSGTAEKRKKPLSLPLRLIIGIGAPLAIIVGVLFLRFLGNPIPCIFHELTGLYCPGCGSGRCFTALARGKIAEAFGYNQFAFIAAPFCGYYLLKVYIRTVLGRDVLPFFQVSSRAAWTVAVLVVAFFIMRNIPFFPFTLLAP